MMAKDDLEKWKNKPVFVFIVVVFIRVVNLFVGHGCTPIWGKS